ncbi:MAG: L,D-transpeptidase family protein [Thermodesulfobacteriota bacterium]|jgi:murein L,D-transpeptidase YafK|nr:MAG: L,D-transpeptidase family protein [Thermodesulfobacteriota bacterium]
MLAKKRVLNSRKQSPPARQIDLVVVEKAKRKLFLLSEGNIIRTYQVALGPYPEGHKLQKDDGKTPEGLYVIDGRNYQSCYHRSLHISYPSQADIQRANQAGVNPGGDIMLHGIRNGLGFLGFFYRKMNWTQGCIAVTNREIEEIWSLVNDGIPIEIKP